MRRVLVWAAILSAAFPVAAADDTIPPQARNNFDKASIAREEGRLGEAATLLRSAIEEHPLYFAAHAAYLDVLRGSGRMSEAPGLYSALLEKNPASFELKVFAAAIKDAPDGRLELATLLAKEPGNVRALIELGRADLIAGDFKEAVKSLKKAVKAEPNLIVGHLLLGDTALRKRRWPTARKAYEAAVQIDPTYAPAHLRLALAWHGQDKTDKALEILGTLLSDENLPRLVAGHWIVALIRAEKEQYRKSIESIDKILAIKPNDLGAELVKSELLMLELDPMGAVKLLTETVKRYPRSPPALFALAWAYERAGDAPELDAAQKQERWTLSADAYDKCAKMDPGVRPRDSVGFVQLLRGEYKLGEQNFKQARDIDPSFAPAQNNLGLSADIADDRKEAMKRYEIVLKKIDRQNVRAMVMLALDHWLQGSPSKAIQLLKQAVKVDPQDDLAWTFLGDVNYDARKYKDAARYYKTAVEINEKNYIAWYHLGLTYEDNLKKEAEADHAYRKALDAKPADPDLDLVLRLALINEDDRLNRLEDALHFYKLYVDLGGTEEWVPDRITALEEYLAGNK